LSILDGSAIPPFSRAMQISIHRFCGIEASAWL
jgi:hypothetical protein